MVSRREAIASLFAHTCGAKMSRGRRKTLYCMRMILAKHVYGSAGIAQRTKFSVYSAWFRETLKKINRTFSLQSKAIYHSSRGTCHRVPLVQPPGVGAKNALQKAGQWGPRSSALRLVADAGPAAVGCHGNGHCDSWGVEGAGRNHAPPNHAADSLADAHSTLGCRRYV